MPTPSACPLKSHTRNGSQKDTRDTHGHRKNLCDSFHLNQNGNETLATRRHSTTMLSWSQDGLSHMGCLVMPISAPWPPTKKPQSKYVLHNIVSRPEEDGVFLSPGHCKIEHHVDDLENASMFLKPPLPLKRISNDDVAQRKNHRPEVHDKLTCQ